MQLLFSKKFEFSHTQMLIEIGVFLFTSRSMLLLLPKTAMKIRVTVTWAGTVNAYVPVWLHTLTNAARKGCPFTGGHPLSVVGTLHRSSLGAQLLRRSKLIVILLWKLTEI